MKSQRLTIDTIAQGRIRKDIDTAFAAAIKDMVDPDRRGKARVIKVEIKLTPQKKGVFVDVEGTVTHKFPAVKHESQAWREGDDLVGEDPRQADFDFMGPGAGDAIN